MKKRILRYLSLHPEASLSEMAAMLLGDGRMIRAINTCITHDLYSYVRRNANDRYVLTKEGKKYVPQPLWNNGRCWTEEELLALKRLGPKDYYISEIAELFGRTESSLEKKLRELGAPIEIVPPKESSSAIPTPAPKKAPVSQERSIQKKAINYDKKIKDLFSEDRRKIATRIFDTFASKTQGLREDKIVQSTCANKLIVQEILKTLKTCDLLRFDEKDKLWYLSDGKNAQTLAKKEVAKPASGVTPGANEKLIDIAKDAARFQSEQIIAAREYVSQRDICCSKADESTVNKDETRQIVYWITTYPTNIKSSLSERFVYRNSPIGRYLQETGLGEDYKFSIEGRANNASSRYKHFGHVLNITDFKRHSIELEGDAKVYLFKDLKKFVERLKEQDGKGGKVPTLTPRELLQAFLRENAQLGFTARMSKQQAAVKYHNLYNNTAVIVDGGPGTGKTTTMISRLKFLTDKHEIEKDLEKDCEKVSYPALKLNQKQKLLELIKTGRDWVFFSPSDILRYYLATAMHQEGLDNAFDKVAYWADFRKHYLERLGLLNERIAKPKFLDYDLDTNSVLITGDFKVVENLERYYIDSFKKPQRTILQGIPAEYASDALKIVEKIESTECKTIEQQIRLFRTLQISYGDKCASALRELRKTTDEIAQVWYDAVTADEQAKAFVLDSLKKQRRSGEPDDEDADLDSEEEDAPKSDDQRIRNFIRELVEPYALWIMNDKKPAPKKELAINTLRTHLDTVDLTALEKTAKLCAFKPIARLSQGVKVNVLKDVAALYKRYRKQVLKDKPEGWNLDLLQRIVDENERNLHEQEQALLIGFINRLCRSVKAQTNDADDHKYMAAYLDCLRPIVGIDEATDFSVLEIFAMISFALPEFNSITLDGDIMQRLTAKGLRDWSDLKCVLPNYEILPLTISYRQSSKMLDVASRLYMSTIGKKPDYTTSINLPAVPDPLVCVDADEDAKIEWIVDSIKDVYEIYNAQLPSIAIFINNPQEAYRFSRKIDDDKFFEDHGISVSVGDEGLNLKEKNQVRIFSIDKVKGMEFDVVFFHNIDQTHFSGDLVKRFVYVGVSRAAFFLGATMSSSSNDLIKYFHTDANWQDL